MQFLVLACALLGVAFAQYTPIGYTAGYQGYPGYNGYQGYQGYPGYQGYLGYQGPLAYTTGYKGYQGYPGYPGYQGYTGYQNPFGYSGYPGYKGYSGYQGFPAHPAFPQIPVAVKPAVVGQKVETVIKSAVPSVPIVPFVPKTAYAEPQAAIRSQSQKEAGPDGSYSYSFETENGIAAAESGAAKIGRSGQEEVVSGEYAYTSPDGTPVHVRYTADENGFHPQVLAPAAYNDGYARNFVAPVVKIEKKAAEKKA